MQQFVECAPLGGLAVDLPSDSGTTIVDCLMTGRRCVLFEHSEAYCEIAANRLEAAAENRRGGRLCVTPRPLR